jgi:hypothetical protein
MTLPRLALWITLAALLSLASPFLTGCKPHTPPAKTELSPGAERTRSAAQNRAVTNLSSCLLEMERDQDAAVEKFLALDLAQGKLFSPDTPLSWSETEFAALEPAVAAEAIKRISADLQIVKVLARDLKTRRDEARTSGQSELADRYNTKLLQLAARLQGPENLKLTQLVGAGIGKMATQ